MIEFAVEHKHIEPIVDSYPEWLVSVATQHGKNISDITYIFTTDDRVLALNKKYLKHDYFTDILTFDRSEGHVLSGDVYISLDRVKENAEQFNVSFENELRRVMVHGILHMIGLKDKNEEQKRHMRDAENAAMELFHVKQ